MVMNEFPGGGVIIILRVFLQIYISLYLELLQTIPDSWMLRECDSYKGKTLIELKKFTLIRYLPILSFTQKLIHLVVLTC